MIPFGLADLPVLLGLGVLLALSALFSGSEAAYFSLAPHDVTRFARSRSRVDRAVASLLARPRALLIAILFGNLLTNVLIFATATVLSTSLSTRGAPTAVVLAVPPAVLLAVIILSELLPKTFGVAQPRRFAVFAAPALVVLRGIVTPAVRPLDVIITYLSRVVTGARTTNRALGPDELRDLLEMQADQGLLARAESDFLQGVVELGEIKVREIMTPRVDIVSFDVRSGREAFLREVRDERKGNMPVHEGDIDELVGVVRTRDVLFSPKGTKLRSIARKPYYVPEAMKAVTLLSELSARHETMAIVVDEYGGTAGLVTLEDVVEEIVGEIEDEFDPTAPAVRRYGAPGSADERFVVRGILSARDAHELFGTGAPGPGDPTTLSGMVAARIDRLPEVGDVVNLGNASLTVSRVERGRVRELIVGPRQPSSAVAGGDDSQRLATVGATTEERAERRRRMRQTSMRKARSQLGTTDRSLPAVVPGEPAPGSEPQPPAGSIAPSPTPAPFAVLPAVPDAEAASPAEREGGEGGGAAGDGGGDRDGHDRKEGS